MHDHIYATFEYPGGLHRHVLVDRVERVRAALRDVLRDQGDADHVQRERSAALRRRRRAARQTAVEVSSTPRRAPASRRRRPSRPTAGRQTTAAVTAAGPDESTRASATDARDLRVLLGDPGRDAADVRTPARVRLGARLHRRVRDGEGGPDEGPDRHDVSRTPYPRIATLKTAAAFRAHLERSGIPLAFDDELTRPAETPLAQPIEVGDVRVGNRFCILPMEGWDGTKDGEPSDLTRRRWRNFGTSGAKLIWGGEAVAVRHDGRANPNQLLITPGNAAGAGAAARRADCRASRALRARRRRGSVRRSSADALGTLRQARRLRPARTAGGVHAPRARSPLSGRRPRREGRGARTARGGFLPAPPASRATPGSPSWTSRPATAISVTSCSAPASGAARTAGRSRTAPGSCAT